MPVKYADRARSTLTTPLTLTTNSGQITVAAGDGAKFMAAIDNVNTEWLTVFIVDGNNWEICDIYQDGVAVTGDDFYIDRMTWGNNNFSFPVGAKIICSVPGEWVSQINATLMTKADLASPAFTGTPSAPTAAVNTNDDQLATTAYAYRIGVRNMDNGGNSINSTAINIQSGRASASQVASGATSINIGHSCTSSNGQSISIGYLTSATALRAIAIGEAAAAWSSSAISIGYAAYATSSQAISIGDNSVASNSNSIAVGYNASSIAVSANAFGYNAKARIASTSVITGGLIVRKDNGESASDAVLFYTASESVYFTKEIDLKVLLDDAAVLTMPTGASFFVDEIGLIITAADTVTVQPEVSFGITGNTTYLLAQTATTVNAALQRQKFTPLTANGLTSLTASVKVAATATTLKGRFYFKGLLVENE